MGRRSKKKQQMQNRAAAYTPAHATQIPFPLWLTRRVLNLPRIARILLTVVCSLAFGVLIIQLVYSIYLQYFFSLQTYSIPTLIALIVGFGVYVLGWRFIVGTVGEKPDESAFVFWYVTTAAFAIVAAIALFLAGYSAINTA
jgi:hypothetical protein